MYVKVFGSILDSSVWDLPDATVRVWITLLAMADEDGIVRAAITGIAKRARKSLEETETALAIFEAPDPYDKSCVDEGRRVRKVPGGWLVINHQAYREIRTTKQRKEAERKAEYRERKKAEETPTESPDVGTVPHVPTIASASASVVVKGGPGENGNGDSPAPAPPALVDVFNPAEVLAKVPPEYRPALEGFIRSARIPTALVAELHATKDGLHGPGYSWEVIGRALQEMAAGGMLFSARLLRACCRKVVEGELGPKPSTDQLAAHRATTSAATIAADKAAADQGDADIVEEQRIADQYRAEHPALAADLAAKIARKVLPGMSRDLATNAAMAKAYRAASPVKVSA